MCEHAYNYLCTYINNNTSRGHRSQVTSLPLFPQVVVTNQITTMSDPNLPEPEPMEEYEGPGQRMPDPESPAPEARDDIPCPMDPVPDLENRVPYQGHNTNPNSCIPDSTTGPENRVSDQGHVTAIENLMPENRVPDQGHVTINDDPDDTLLCPEESVGE